MNPLTIFLILIGYFGLLITIAHFTGKRQSNRDFFIGNHQSPWFLVAFGMIGASVSGISIVSVPGMVVISQMTYMQTVIGFFFGYLGIAYVLLPLYYKLNLTSIYGYLGKRFGQEAHKTGSAFFILAKLVSAAAKLYVAVLILQEFVFSQWHIPIEITVIASVVLIWFYTRKSGIRTLVFTDALQTFFMILAIVLILIEAFKMMQIPAAQTLHELSHNTLSRIFVFSDWKSTQNFFKQFFSGIFIVIVMTGLDQDMMQKNLSCKNLKESRKNMLSYAPAFIPVNLMLLTIGAILVMYANRHQMTLPESPDKIVPFFVSASMGKIAVLSFVLGIIAASFSSADSALTAITTTFAVDFLKLGQSNDTRAEKIRRLIHVGVCVIFIIIVLVFNQIKDKSIIDTIYKIVGYLYGPLLGMFAFGLFTKRSTNVKRIPIIAILSPILCYIIQLTTTHLWNYHWGYELLMLNGFITFALLATNGKPQTNVI